MNYATRLIQTMLSPTGYQLVRKQNLHALQKHKTIRPERSDHEFRFQNFENLVSAYEHAINQQSDSPLIPPNPLRAKLLARLLGTPPSEAYFIIAALAKTRELEGEVCEFGVAQGETSALIANEIADTQKQLHLFDSFAGLPKPTAQDQLKDDIFALGTIEAYAGTMMSPVDLVLARFQAISFPPARYILHQGFIEELILRETNLPTQVSCAYIDFDFYQPIRVALQFLHTVTPRGARIIVDDYDFFSTGAKTAVDEFLDEQNKLGRMYESFTPDTRLGYFSVLTKVGQ